MYCCPVSVRVTHFVLPRNELLFDFWLRVDNHVICYLLLSSASKPPWIHVILMSRLFIFIFHVFTGGGYYRVNAQWQWQWFVCGVLGVPACHRTRRAPWDVVWCPSRACAGLTLNLSPTTFSPQSHAYMHTPSS